MFRQTELDHLRGHTASGTFPFAFPLATDGDARHDALDFGLLADDAQAGIVPSTP